MNIYTHHLRSHHFFFCNLKKALFIWKYFQSCIYFLFISLFNIFTPTLSLSFHAFFAFLLGLLTVSMQIIIYLKNDEWLNSSWLTLASDPAPHLRNDCWPCPNTFLVCGSCCLPTSPLAHDYLIFFHLLLAGFPSMKIPTPILTHQDPQPLWKTKLIPFHLPSPTVDSPLLLTQIWVWHPKLVRHFHPPFIFFYFFF